MFTVTLVYADTSTWLAGGFETEDEANSWIAIERTRPYWVESTTAHVVEVE